MGTPSVRVRLLDGQEFGPADDALLLQWAREGRIPPSASVVSPAGEAVPAPNHPILMPLFNAPPVARPVIAAPPADDGGISSLIPYKNPPALTGYYTAVASLIPGLGLLLGPVAVVLGVIGFRAYRRDPRRKGAAHAWVAIILGSLTTLLYWAIAVFMLVAILSR
jgi:hypothetical protein